MTSYQTIKNWPAEDRPREKLIDKGPQALTDTELLAIILRNGNASTAYMGLLSVLLQWHAQDPVDAQEQLRNDVIYSYQGNRNPFVDNPQWVACIFQNVCP